MRWTVFEYWPDSGPCRFVSLWYFGLWFLFFVNWRICDPFVYLQLPSSTIAFWPMFWASLSISWFVFGMFTILFILCIAFLILSLVCLSTPYKWMLTWWNDANLSNSLGHSCKPVRFLADCYFSRYFDHSAIFHPLKLHDRSDRLQTLSIFRPWAFTNWIVILSYSPTTGKKIAACSSVARCIVHLLNLS